MKSSSGKGKQENFNLGLDQNQNEIVLSSAKTKINDRDCLVVLTSVNKLMVADIFKQEIMHIEALKF